MRNNGDSAHNLIVGRGGFEPQTFPFEIPENAKGKLMKDFSGWTLVT